MPIVWLSVKHPSHQQHKLQQSRFARTWLDLLVQIVSWVSRRTHRHIHKHTHMYKHRSRSEPSARLTTAIGHFVSYPLACSCPHSSFVLCLILLLCPSCCCFFA